MQHLILVVTVDSPETTDTSTDAFTGWLEEWIVGCSLPECATPDTAINLARRPHTLQTGRIKIRAVVSGKES